MIFATSKGLKQNVDLLGLDVSLSEESLGLSLPSPRGIMDAEKRPLESGSAPLGRKKSSCQHFGKAWNPSGV
jgi:hypothetical protein